jgi:hypothetical protein
VRGETTAAPYGKGLLSWAPTAVCGQSSAVPITRDNLFHPLSPYLEDHRGGVVAPGYVPPETLEP